MPALGHWWCPKCREVVGEMQVTATEAHVDCGGLLKWVDDEAEADDLDAMEQDAGDNVRF